MGAQHTFPPARASRLATILLNRHSPGEIAEAIEILIDVLDLMGGDPDAEETDAEDSFSLSWIAKGNGGGPGCPIGDPGGVVTSEDEPDMFGATWSDGPWLPEQRRRFGDRRWSVRQH